MCDSEGLDSIFLAGFVLLEIALHLESAIATLCHAEPFGLGLEPWCFGSSMMVHKSVGVGRLGAEACCHDQFLVDFGLEAGGHFFNSLAEGGCLCSKLVELLLVRHQIRQVELLIRYGDLRAHVHAKALGEGGEINVTLFLRVEDVPHERGHLLLSNIDLVGEQVRFEILVRYETISIFIKLAEHLVHLVFAIENLVFNFAHHGAKSPSIGLVFSPAENWCLHVFEVLVDEGWRGVWS